MEKKSSAHFLQQNYQVTGTALQRQLARLCLRQQSQIVHQPVQMTGLIIQAGDFRFFERVDIVQNRLQIAFQNSEGRT